MITVNGQTAEGPSFTYTEASYDVKLEVNELEKTSGYAGDEIVITGKGFITTAEENEVYFGEKAATITACTTTSLTVTVPKLEPGNYELTFRWLHSTDFSFTFVCYVELLVDVVESDIPRMCIGVFVTQHTLRLIL